MRLFTAFDRKQTGPSEAGLCLRVPGPTDYDAWHALRAQSAKFLIPWEPKWPRDDLSREGFRRRLRRYRRDSELGVAVTWFLYRERDTQLLGGLTYSNIRYGASSSAQLGYWMGEPYAGKGYMTQAVDLSLREMFFVRGLERIEAACVPNNRRSIALLDRNGFRQEGLLRGYLEINGERRDHLLYALLKDEYEPLTNTREAKPQDKMPSEG